MPRGSCAKVDPPPLARRPGSYANLPGSVVCVFCAPGKFTNISGSTSAASVRPTHSQTHPIKRRADHAMRKNNSGRSAGPRSAPDAPPECLRTPNSPKKGCARRPENSASLARVRVLPGGYVQQLGRPACLPCPAGRHGGNVSGGEDEASACRRVPNGNVLFRQGYGRVRLQSLRHGTYSNVSGQRVVAPDCPSGYFSDGGGGVAVCRKCGVGKYQLTSGSASCAPCMPGESGNSTGLVRCPRQRGTFAARRTMSPRHAVLVPLGAIRTRLAPSLVSRACGSVWTPIWASCVRFVSARDGSNRSESQACEPCDIGKSSRTNGSIQCTSCPAGKYGQQREEIGSAAAGACTDCPIGQFEARRIRIHAAASLAKCETTNRLGPPRAIPDLAAMGAHSPEVRASTVHPDFTKTREERKSASPASEENLESDGHSSEKPPWKTNSRLRVGRRVPQRLSGKLPQWVCEAACREQPPAPRLKTCAQERMVDGTEISYPQPDEFHSVPAPRIASGTRPETRHAWKGRWASGALFVCPGTCERKSL